MTISIIIPAYNEATGIAKLVRYLRQYGSNSLAEIIVSDGGSTDHTQAECNVAGAVFLNSPAKGRAAQMNFGAAKATGDILYFVHADTFPPMTFVSDVITAVKEGFAFGRYITKFDSKDRTLLINAYFTRFDLFMCYGGDQTLFMTRQLFSELGGFNGNMRIMEDYEIVVRAKKIARYRIIKKKALISARKYDTNGWLKVQMANYRIIRMYHRGASQEDMAETYKRLLVYR